MVPTIWVSGYTMAPIYGYLQEGKSCSTLGFSGSLPLWKHPKSTLFLGMCQTKKQLDASIKDTQGPPNAGIFPATPLIFTGRSSLNKLGIGIASAPLLSAWTKVPPP